MNEQFEQLYIRDNNSNNSRNMPDLYSGYATAQRQADGSAAINVRLQRPDNNVVSEQAKHGWTHYFAVGVILGLTLLGLFTAFIIGLILLVMIL